MKCIVLAGGKGDRLWPLSRKSYPKQFIQLRGDHSVFQETIARNMPYCDEFIIVTNKEYKFIVENQISAFQGLVHRYIYEGVGRKTAAAITLACMMLQPSDMVLIVPADQLVEGNEYKADLMRARELGVQGNLVTFGMPVGNPEERFGYIHYQGENVLDFSEKPDREMVQNYMLAGDYYTNSGMFLFYVGNYISELKKYSPEIYAACTKAFRMRQTEPGSYTFSEDIMKSIPAAAVEKAVFERTESAKVVKGSFFWKDIGSLEDLKSTELIAVEDGPQVQYHCENVDIINRCPRRVIVANELQDMLVVNTKDAVYVGRKGASNNLKAILEENTQIRSYVEGGRVIYRQWGSYELLVDTPHYRVKKVMISPEKTIYEHKHLYRGEHWSVVSGQALISLDGVSRHYSTNDVIVVKQGMLHQVSNVGNDFLVIIEVSVGENVTEDDKVAERRQDLTEGQLGLTIEPFVKLAPAFKDYLWGGNRLREIYHKKCDYDIIAESWELSAHEAGQSIVTTGRHNGMPFAKYLQVIGKENWGWKCGSLETFPILIKFIDARQSLSVQVHPGDDYALSVENQYGKNEMWYIIDCEPNSFLYCGFNRDVNREEVCERLQDNTILEILNKVPVQRGEAYFIPAGTVHAIGEGILICEIQQSSNCTYRLYDYCRKDKFGNLREIHIEKALDVLQYSAYKPQKLADTAEKEADYTRSVISRCKYFECVKYCLAGEMELAGVEESFTSLICIRGEGRVSCGKDNVHYMDFTAGESLFMPKSTEIYRVEGHCELIITRI